jgi:pSer/pThr/pTyr-binding forkhead associated (FHA) protein
MVKLVVISDEMKGLEFELNDEKITVGRLPDNRIRLDHSAVSSHHAEMTRKGDDYLVRDLNSTNGTRVNGQRIVETRLYHGDTIGFAHIQMQYISTSRAAPQPLPSPSKKTVDLTASQINLGMTKKPQGFASSSPFSARQKKAKFKKVFQVLALVAGIVGVVLLIIAIISIFQK